MSSCRVGRSTPTARRSPSATSSTSDDRVLQFASLSFDVSIEDILPTLVSGARLVLRDDAMAESFDDLLDTAADEGITVLNLPTAFWHDLVRHLDVHGANVPESLRLMVVGGEKVERAAYDRWAELVPGVRWINGYGPTEATVTCTTFDPAEQPAIDAGSGAADRSPAAQRPGLRPRP